MWWLVLVLLASLITALTVFFDNYIVDVVFKRRSPISQKIVYALLHPIIIAIILIFFPIEKMELGQALSLIMVGIMYSAALIPYYFALKQENATATEILSQTEPIFCLVLGMIFLGENLGTLQLVAFALIVSAACITVFKKRKREQKANFKAAVFTTISAIIWAISDLFFVAAGEGHDYASTLMYILIGRSIVDWIILLTFKKERKYCFSMLKKSGLKAWWAIITDHFLEITSDLIYRFALLMGPVAIVSAAGTATELIFTFLLGLVLTLIWPKFGREKLDRRTILVHSSAIILLIIGMLLVG